MVTITSSVVWYCAGEKLYGNMSYETDPTIPPLPTADEFSQFFLYIGYDTINEKCLSKTEGANNHGHQQYKKFVQNNKESGWAQVLLAAVSVVHTAKNHYKSMLSMLSSRNMVALHKVCVDISTNNIPPHKEVRNLERCYITGVWHERCIDVSKGVRGGGGGGGGLLVSGNTSDRVAESREGESLSNSCSSSVASSSNLPSPTTPASLLRGGGCGPSSSPSITLESMYSTQTMYCTTTSTGSATTGVYISPKFRHFAHMLWTTSKLDTIIKNYTTSWLQVCVHHLHFSLLRLLISFH